jgi:HSP20 family protein
MTRYWLSNPWSYDPLPHAGELRHRMEELFDRMAGGSPGMARAGVHPPVNLYESGDSYVLTAELPGLRVEDIQVSVERDRVTLRGERRIEHPQDASLHRVERHAGAFRRTIQLPVEVDGEKVEAVYRNGVLTLRIPKAPEHQPRRITVQGS